MKKIALFNRKGGVGKSTLTTNLGHGLAYLGYKTLIIDMDGQRNCELFLGVEEPKLTLYDVFDNRRPEHIKNVIVKNVRDNLDFIGNYKMEVIEADLHRESNHFKFFSDRMKGLEELDYDVILVDCGPSETRTNDVIMSWVDEIAVVTEAEAASVTGASQVYGYLNRLGQNKDKVRYVIPNKLGHTKDHQENLEVLHEFFKESDVAVTVTEPIYRRTKISEAAKQGLTVFEHDTEATKQILKALESVVNNLG